MVDILHRVGIKSSSPNDAHGESKVGETIRFRFGELGGFDMKVLELDPSRRVLWEPVEFMHHCSTKWAIFLMSLKSLLETGKGGPWPNDVQISDWH